MVKRKLEPEPMPELERYSLGDLAVDLQAGGGKELVAMAVLDILRRCGLNLNDVKSYKESLPVFANGCWEKDAPKFGLVESSDFFQLGSFTVPRLSLPPSFHKTVMMASAQWLDVYQEHGVHGREAARVRLMDAWHVPICALFKGRIVDKPEHPMPTTPETSGGEIEHEVYMTEGIILIVLELKLYIKNLNDHVAQVMLALASAYKLNGAKEFANQPPVYAVLTDLKDFYFFHYDGSTFTLYQEVTVSTRTRVSFLDGMRNVSEHLFSIIFDGYISVLDAIAARSTKISGFNSASPGMPQIRNSSRGPRPSLTKWTPALTDAKNARLVLQQRKYSSMEEWEKFGGQGLALLQRSVLNLPKIGSHTDWTQETLELEVDKVLREQLK